METGFGRRNISAITAERGRPARGPTAAGWVAALAVLFAAQLASAAQPEYRTFFDPAGSLGWLSPRLIIWIFAQLHLLFAAFVLAVPMFVVIIELVSLVSKDPEQAKRYNGLAHEFCRLLGTAFSVTSILGAVFTFAALYLYPKMFSYLVDAFGPTMYLYALLFFGESFSLYLYYYGWGKVRRWTHFALGLLLNAFGITLMLIANAWTTFMMAPAGLDEAGKVVDRSAAFWNFLLHPINIHRLIANMCMGGSVAAAYAAFRFLSTKDPEKRAYYDWMGYVGNFVAVLALLPLPFAGYYLGFEIYQFNQQLGVYMMGGVLSWLFIVQAVLIGALFFAANYYLWLGMDRIEGSERYRGWIKWLLATVTICILVWATPKSLILTTEDIRAMGGISHPILSIFGVMSAKNTAVNLVILATFLSFILYRRGNKVPTVEWAGQGKLLQALAFGGAAAVVVFIGVGGYIPGLWLESEKRIGMSPYQVLVVLACIIVVMFIDILMFRRAKEIGRIRWGRVSRRSQYALIFLAVTFTWTMSLMGFVRSSLRQHWHVYEVLKDTSPEAYTPALGPATVVVTAVVMLFFCLVAMVVWIASLGTKPAADVDVPLTAQQKWRRVGVFAAIIALVILGSLIAGGHREPPPPDRSALEETNKRAKRMLTRYDVVNPDHGIYAVPIERAMKLLAANTALLGVTDERAKVIDRGGSRPQLAARAKGAVLSFRRARGGGIGLALLGPDGASQKVRDLAGSSAAGGPVLYAKGIALVTRPAAGGGKASAGKQGSAKEKESAAAPGAQTLHLFSAKLEPAGKVSLADLPPVQDIAGCGGHVVVASLSKDKALSLTTVVAATRAVGQPRQVATDVTAASIACLDNDVHVVTQAADGALSYGKAPVAGTGAVRLAAIAGVSGTAPQMLRSATSVAISWRAADGRRRFARPGATPPPGLPPATAFAYAAPGTVGSFDGRTGRLAATLLPQGGGVPATLVLRRTSGRVAGPDAALLFLGDKLLLCAKLPASGLSCSSQGAGPVQLLDSKLNAAQLAQKARAQAKAGSPAGVASALVQRAERSFRAGHRDEALATAKLAVAVAPNHAVALYQLARLQARQRAAKPALAALSKLRGLKSVRASELLRRAASDPAFSALRANPTFSRLTSGGR